MDIRFQKYEHHVKYQNMKAKEKKEKSIMKQLREIRDKISLEIQGMTTEQINKYLDKKEPLHPMMYNKSQFFVWID